MLCVPIKGPSFEEAYQQIEKATSYAQLVELRLDQFTSFETQPLQKLINSFAISFIFTLRDQTQGGFYKGSEEERKAHILKLAELSPDYFDIESHVSKSFVEKVKKQFPKIKIILSYHDFEKTAVDLKQLYKELCQTAADLYKIAVKANSSLDMMRMVQLVSQAEKKLIGISMGNCGAPSRIYGPILGSPITFSSLDDNHLTAPGQISLKEMTETYHYQKLSDQSLLLGLLGDPVDKSVSHITHNMLMDVFQIDGVYMKMPVKTEELNEFLQIARVLLFRGLSVTMPLKEDVCSCLDEIDPDAKAIGAVNTLVFKDKKIKGYNTDCIGAINALERHIKIKGSRIVILGAGGAAKAVIYGACKAGADVTILNRDVEKAKQCAIDFSCKGGGYDLMSKCYDQGYDIIINCTSVEMPIDPKYIRSDALVMDIKTRPKMTDFLQKAKENGSRLCFGYEMFVEQALWQFKHWFGEKFDIAKGREILEEITLRSLS